MAHPYYLGCDLFLAKNASLLLTTTSNAAPIAVRHTRV